jgi:RIO kinase 1
VTVHHRNAEEFLRRDCRNVANFFARQGIETDPDELYAFVTAEDDDDATAVDGPDADGSGTRGRER